MKTVHANNSDGGQTRSTITLPTIAIDPIYHYQMQKVLDMDTYSLGVKGTLWLNIWSTPSHVELADWSNNWSWFQDSNHLRLSKYSAKHPAMRLLHEAGHLSKHLCSTKCLTFTINGDHFKELNDGWSCNLWTLQALWAVWGGPKVPKPCIR